MVAAHLCGGEGGSAAPCTKLLSVGLGKNRCSVNAVAFVPDTPRLFAASAMGDISVWTSSSLTFERMLPAQNAAIQVMRYNRSGTYMFTGDAEGNVKYWESSLTAREDFRAHSEGIHGIECVASFFRRAPTRCCVRAAHAAGLRARPAHQPIISAPPPPCAASRPLTRST